MLEDSTPDEVTAAAEAAAGAARAFGDPDATPLRIAALGAIADAMDAAKADLVALAQAESHLPEGRLNGELTRTTYQLRMFAEYLAEGSWAEATIDTADPDWALGPKPDLRRLLVSVGPVAVYAASNFPFAFSVAGGDTAAALAAGSPVVVKAHPGHLELSARTAQIVIDALASVGAPAGMFALVSGFEAGKQLVTEPAIKAGSFTGSIPAGRALYDLACARPEPIPFYGELGSLNPVFVTARAVAARGEALAKAFVGSYTLGTGQFCTKPGLLFLPADSDLLGVITDASAAVAAAPMLNAKIAAGYVNELTHLTSHPGVQVLVQGAVTDGVATPTIVATDVTTLLADTGNLLRECFGPTSLVVTYADDAELVAAATAFTGNLTATVHGEDDDATEVGELLAILRERAGRVLWNGWPTGVAVSWGMQHGGPWPATTASIHTSVGPTAIRRFLRPVSYQDMPDAALPKVLRRVGATPSVRRVNGEVQVP